ncbi:MAG: FliM/FliN family flagellar motor switch protein [Litoreibacter sp.]
MTQTPSVLRKKLRPRAPSRAPCHGPLERHSDEIFRKVFKNGFELNVEVPEIDVRRVETEKALESLPEISVTLLLSSADQEFGLCVINGELNDGLIEQQTLGRVIKSLRGDRAVTQIDAALCEVFVRKVLATMEEDLAAVPQAAAVLGYVCDKAQFDREELALTLTSQQMDVLKVTLDLGPDVKTGFVEFWFPAKGAVISPDGMISNPVGPRLCPHVLDVEVGVKAMLDPVPIALGKMMDLKVGDIVEIPREALVSARIMDQRGVLMTRARLGQLDGRRAARVTGIKPTSSVAHEAAPEMDEGMIVPGGKATDKAGTMEDIGHLDGLDGLPPLDSLPDMDGMPPTGEVPNSDGGAIANIKDDFALDPASFSDVDDARDAKTGLALKSAAT